MTKKISILSTGLANVSSVVAAFNRLDLEAEFVESKAKVDYANLLVVPGVGAFGAGMRRLNELGVVDAIRERVRQDRPTLGICLGMQLLCNSSEENSGVEGLGIINGAIERFNSDMRIPQLGWNKIETQSETGFVNSGYAYFANSYCLKTVPDNCVVTTTLHGENFISSLQQGNLLACQFHPELSGDFGQSILRKWSSL